MHSKLTQVRSQYSDFKRARTPDHPSRAASICIRICINYQLIKSSTHFGAAGHGLTTTEFNLRPRRQRQTQYKFDRVAGTMTTRSRAEQLICRAAIKTHAIIILRAPGDDGHVWNLCVFGEHITHVGA